MRMLFVSLAAALSALALGGAAVAGQGGLGLQDVVGLSAAASEEATEAATEEATEDVDDADGVEETDRAALTSDDADRKSRIVSTDDETETDAGTASNEDAFGQIRSAEVHAARDAGETPDPAWQNEAHPTGGPEGEQATAAERRPTTSSDETSDDADESDDADTAEAKGANAKRGPAKGD